MSNFLLLYGDVVVVEKCGHQEFQIVGIEVPSKMGHFFSVMPAPSHEDKFTKRLHELGGEWECDAGALFMLHVPQVHREKFEAETGFRLDEEVFGGIVPEQRPA